MKIKGWEKYKVVGRFEHYFCHFIVFVLDINMYEEQSVGDRYSVAVVGSLNN